MAVIHLLLGPVGAGKTTYGRRLSSTEQALFFNLDEWMAHLFRADRPENDVLAWYQERVERLTDHIWRMAEAALLIDCCVVMELGLVFRTQREAFLSRLDVAGHPVVLHLLDAPRDVRRERVLGRNASCDGAFPFEVPLAVFEKASDLWEPIDEAEYRGRKVVHVLAK